MTNTTRTLRWSLVTCKTRTRICPVLHGTFTVYVTFVEIAYFVVSLFVRKEKPNFPSKSTSSLLRVLCMFLVRNGPVQSGMIWHFIDYFASFSPWRFVPYTVKYTVPGLSWLFGRKLRAVQSCRRKYSTAKLHSLVALRLRFAISYQALAEFCCLQLATKRN